MSVNISYGVTLAEYRAIEPTLQRPLTLGGIKRRPRTDADLHGLHIKDIQKKPSSASAKMSRSRAKHAA